MIVRPNTSPIVVAASFLALASLLLLFAAESRAALFGATTIDGPDSSIVEFGDVAVAEDGTGGAVWLKRVGGRNKVFAAVYRDGAWNEPQRIDVGQAFDSSWPRIGAGNGGRLVVTWVHEFGPSSDRLFSASLDPGSKDFEAPLPIDLDIREGNATWPSLSMNRSGQAYIVYRVVTDPGPSPLLPEGYVFANTRVARYNGWTWSRLDQTLDRNSALYVREPSADNAPKILIDGYGNGVASFQEPDGDFIDRVWARRVFGGVLGLALPVSPTSYAGKPLLGGADQISLSGGFYGDAAISFRQDPGAQKPFDRPRVMMATMGDVFSSEAGGFAPAQLVDQSPADAGETAGPSAAAASRDSATAIFSAGGSVFKGGLAGGSVAATSVLGTGPTSGAAGAVATASREGRLASAWTTSVGGVPHVALREESGGQSTQLTTRGGMTGQIRDLRLGGSGLGDALVGFRVTQGSTSEIAVAEIDAPPLEFAVHEPNNWLRTPNPTVSWDESLDALGSVDYQVRIGARAAATVRGSTTWQAQKLGDGLHTISIVANDRAGQSRDAQSAVIRIDTKAPKARVRKLNNGRIEVLVTDGARGRSSGISPKARVRWGDGKSTRLRARTRKTYKRGGSYRLVIQLRDRAGNTRTVRRTVRL